MFTFLSRMRRQTAVLTALALVASVLVAVPVSAADDPPKSSYGATFTACLDIPEAEFGDVLDTQTDEDNINCIAYYNITMGKSATTYDPLASVTREEMALFLTRLADVVGIPMVADPADPGFTDIGDLPSDSQTAIAQLKELGITKGNNASGTTYGPGHQVTRGDMALFIARLMRKMTPISDGDDSGTDWGYTPADVEKNEAVKEDDGSAAHIGTPFGDLDRVTKETYDAITNLYELKVASGISATAYGPSQSIRRDHMARFMAGVLHHSNARPAGLTIQATGIAPFGSYKPTVVVSYRDDKFQPVADTSIAMFNAPAAGFQDDGTCFDSDAAACAWSDDDNLTDASGNNTDYALEDDVTPNGKVTIYAWMGDADTTKFDLDNGLHKTITLEATHNADRIRVTSDINPNSASTTKPADKPLEIVNLDRDSSVTYMVQLIDANGDPVHKKDVEIKVGLIERPNSHDDTDPSYNASEQEVLKTDSKGQATFTTRKGPKSTGTGSDNDDAERYDTITFIANGLDDDDPATDDNALTGDEAGKPDETVEKRITWTDVAPVLTSGSSEADKFVIGGTDGKVRVKASVTYYDQYGNPAAKGGTVPITISGDPSDRTVSSRGTASYTRTFDTPTSGDISVTIGSLTLNRASATPTNAVPTVSAVKLVRRANSGQVTVAAGVTVGDVYDGNRFFLTVGSDALLYSYDADDIFVVDDKRRTGTDGLEAFTKKIKTKTGDAYTATVQVLVYDTKGSSIFKVS